MYTIVKYAADNYWEYYFRTDPKLGVHVEMSAAFSYSGQAVGLKEVYSTLEDALPDLAKIHEFNPCAGYAVCPVETFQESQL